MKQWKEQLTDGNAGEGGAVHVFEEAGSQRHIDSIPLRDQTHSVSPCLSQLGQRFPHARRWETTSARLEPNLQQNAEYTVAQLISDVV